MAAAALATPRAAFVSPLTAMEMSPYVVHSPSFTREARRLNTGALAGAGEGAQQGLRQVQLPIPPCIRPQLADQRQQVAYRPIARRRNHLQPRGGHHAPHMLAYGRDAVLEM